MPLKPKHGLLAGIILVFLAVGTWLVFGRGDAPAELALGERAVVEDGVEEATGPSTAVAPVEFTNVKGCNIPPRVKEAAYMAADVGISRLSVVEGSIAGYRVVEDFIGGLANVDAVGRTTAVQGDLFTHTGIRWVMPAPDEDSPSPPTVPPVSDLSALWGCVDVASITSDKGSRDNRFRGPIMDTANFPVATFVAVPLSPYLDSDIPDTGSATLDISGFLTLVGKGKAAKASVTIQRAEEPYDYELVAQIPVVFSDFEIDNPSNSIVSVRDEGLIEVSLTLAWNSADALGR